MVDDNPQTSAPKPVLQVTVILLSNGQVVAHGPVDNKGDCIGLLAAGIQAVIAHRPSPLVLPQGALPKVIK